MRKIEEESVTYIKDPIINNNACQLHCYLYLYLYQYLSSLIPISTQFFSLPLHSIQCMLHRLTIYINCVEGNVVWCEVLQSIFFEINKWMISDQASFPSNFETLIINLDGNVGDERFLHRVNFVT